MTKPYNVTFDSGLFGRQPEILPGRNIKTDFSKNVDLKPFKDYLRTNFKSLCKEPFGGMRHPYLVPGSVYVDLWDWDTYFISCAVPEDGLAYAKGSVMNLLDGVLPDTGRPSKRITPGGDRDFFSYPYPLQAQFAYVMGSRLGDYSWVEPYWDNLVNIRAWYDNCARSKDGYFIWLSMYGNGIDNNPAVYGRPTRSAAGIDLACWHYRDMVAMAKLAEKLGKKTEVDYRAKAEELKKLIQNKYWDSIDKFFYSIDCTTDESQKTRQEINWVYFMKFRSFACLFPMWAGVATKEQAAFVRDKIMDENEYLSCCGIRTHSKIDPVYNNVPMSDPSNWQGPVWGLSSYLTAYGLARYGYHDDAAKVCHRMDCTFAADIKENGFIHEYYDGETGQPLIRPEFLSWNMLGLTASEDIANKRDCTTLDLLD